VKGLFPSPLYPDWLWDSPRLLINIPDATFLGEKQLSMMMLRPHFQLLPRLGMQRDMPPLSIILISIGTYLPLEL
jgi:hypothetical protein